MRVVVFVAWVAVAIVGFAYAALLAASIYETIINLVK